MKKYLVFACLVSLFCCSCVSTGSLINASTSTAPAATTPVEQDDTYKSPQTFVNEARNFQYTIPAGWYLVAGEPDSESVNFMKKGTTLGFIIHIEQMVPSFPRGAAVKAGLKQDKERMQINKVLEAVRRDDGDPKKNCGVIGWEQTEAPQKNGFQRIIWQAYDGENFYMNFNAHSDNKDFAAAKPVLREIMDSIKFCVR